MSSGAFDWVLSMLKRFRKYLKPYSATSGVLRELERVSGDTHGSSEVKA